MTFGHAFICHKKQNSRYAHKSIDDTDAFVMEFAGEVSPGGKIESAVLFVDRTRDTLIEKRERALNRGDMDRQIRPVQDQDLAVEQGRSRRTREDGICGGSHMT